MGDNPAEDIVEMLRAKRILACAFGMDESVSQEAGDELLSDYLELIACLSPKEVKRFVEWHIAHIRAALTPTETRK